MTEVAQAEIDKKVQIVNAEKARDTNVINAEAAKTTKLIDAEAEKESVRLKADGEKASTVLIADGKYQAKKFEAEGIEAEGLARAVAEKELQLAPVAAQIELANKIGENQNYQQYLTTLKQFDAMIAVGIEQAKALEKADIKVIANGGSVNSGMNKVMDLFSSQGGTSIGSMLEAFANTDTGKSLLDKLTGESGKPKE